MQQAKKTCLQGVCLRSPNKIVDLVEEWIVNVKMGKLDHYAIKINNGLKEKEKH